jgi:acetylornithine deacetylase/succinyl-diaminopimelate desuccinylase-like protein
MRKIIIISSLLICSCVATVKAQMLAHTSWKTYLPALNDTVILNFSSDEETATTPSGDTLVRSHAKFSGDTVTFIDYDGKYLCIDQPGVYRYAIKMDTLSLMLVSDACENRASNIVTAIWIRASHDPAKK